MKEIKERRSIRKYKDEPISRDKILTILQAGILAPSAKNRQPWRYIVYVGEEKKKLLAEMERGLLRERDGNKLLPKSYEGLPDAFNTLHIMNEAPVLILIENSNGCSPFVEINAEDRVTEICDTLSIGASVENILLKAKEIGYGTLWIANTFFAYNELVDFTGINGQLAGAISMGIPDESPFPRPRKSISEVVKFRGL